MAKKKEEIKKDVKKKEDGKVANPRKDFDETLPENKQRWTR